MTKVTPNHSLRQERELRGWSQRYVAEQINAPASSYIHRWERGIASPSPYYREKLCAIFGKNAHELGFLQTKVDAGSDYISPKPALPIPSFASSTSLWNMPYRRNPFFTGREDVLRYLHSMLHMDQPEILTQPQAISGLGGIGKTQIAVEYAYRFRDDYCAVLWVRAETRDVLISDCMIIANLLDLPQKNEQSQISIIAALKHWLSSHTNWLLILDNLEDLTITESILPPDHMGHVLLTTRTQFTGGFARRIDPGKMEPNEGALLLLRRAKHIEQSAFLEKASSAEYTAAKAISSLMDGLPLAIDQAGAYIDETGCSLADYLNYYRNRRTALLNRRGEITVDHPQSVCATFSLSFERLEQRNLAAAELLCLCAFLHPEAIPEEIITEGASELSPVLRGVATDPLLLDAAILTLRTSSLLQRNSDTKMLSIHRLVQTLLKDTMDENELRHWAEQVVRVVNRAFPDAEEISLWPRCQRCLPHAQTCAILIKQWSITSKEAEQLLYKLATYLWKLGECRQAESRLQELLDIRVQVLGSEHPDVAECLNNFAVLYQYQGQYMQAELFHQRALAIREKTLGSEHLDVAESLTNLAELYLDQKKQAQAEPLHKRALNIRERRLGPEHLLTSLSLNDLARLYTEEGQYEQGERLFIRILTLYEKTLGSEHPYVATILKNYAALLSAMEREVEARTLIERAKQIQARHIQQDGAEYNTTD